MQELVLRMKYAIITRLFSSTRRYKKKKYFSDFFTNLILQNLKEELKTISLDVAKPITSTKLILLPMGLERNQRLWESVPKFRVLMDTRGRLRWLLQKLIPELKIKSYTLNRLQIMIYIAKNLSTFKLNVLDRLALANEHQITSTVSSSEYTVAHGNFILDKKKYYVLESELKSKFRFDFQLSKLDFTLFDQLLKIAPNDLRLLIQENDEILNVLELGNYRVKYPDFFLAIDSSVNIKYEIHPLSKFTLDYISNNYAGKIDEFSLKNVSILHQRFIMQNNQIIILDATCDPTLEFVAGHWQYINSHNERKNTINLKNFQNFEEVEIDKAIMLSGRADENWFHFLIDTVPKLFILNKEYSDYPILIRSDLPESSKLFLKKLTNQSFIELDSDKNYRVKELISMPGRSTVFDSKPANNQSLVLFSPETLKITSSIIKEKLGLFIHNNDRKIYIPRDAKYRNVINNRSLNRFAISRGFEIVDVDDRYFRQQVELFHESKCIMTPGGATLANMIFMNIDSKLFTFVSWRNRSHRLWINLADIFSINLTEVRGVPTYFGGNSMRRMHSNFYAPIIFLKLIMRKID